MQHMLYDTVGQHHHHPTITMSTQHYAVAGASVTAAFKPDPPTLIDPNLPQAFCLRWNMYQANLTSVFEQLLQNEQFVDVTLSCDGVSIKAHKVVLSACSPYFTALFNDNPCKHPIIIMRDIKLAELKAIVEFMYRGEINVCQDQIGPLLRIAELLKIRGLADVSADQRVDVETAPAPPAATVAEMLTQSAAPNVSVPVTVAELVADAVQPAGDEKTVYTVSTADWNENITTTLSVPVQSVHQLQQQVHQSASIPTVSHSATSTTASTATADELMAVDVLVSAAPHQPQQQQQQQQPHTIVLHHHQQQQQQLQHQPIVVDVIHPMPAAQAAAPPTIAATAVRASTGRSAAAKPHRKRKLLNDKTLESLLSDETTASESSVVTNPAATPTLVPATVTTTPAATSTPASTRPARARKATSRAAVASASTSTASVRVKAEQSPVARLASPSQDTFHELVIVEELKAIKMESQNAKDEATAAAATTTPTTTMLSTTAPDEAACDESDDNNSITQTSESKTFSSFLKLKAPTWSQQQLREAINSVITQKLRFTQASSRYNIPKGTLYDNILGKANRMLVLAESGLNNKAEMAVLDFCCDVSVSPYNRRTKKPLAQILAYVQQLSNSLLEAGKPRVKFGGKFGFRWWWAFCKKHSIVSLHYGDSVAAAAAMALPTPTADLKDEDDDEEEEEEVLMEVVEDGAEVGGVSSAVGGEDEADERTTGAEDD